MNSLILSWICSAFTFLKNAFWDSFLGRLINKIYSGISGCFKKSLIPSWFKAEKKKRSVAADVLRFPLRILEGLSRLFSKVLSSFSKRSVLAAALRKFYDFFAGVNTRFFGGIALGFGVSSLFTMGGRLPIAAIALGLILMIRSINLSGYLEGSFFVSLAKKAFDFEDISFSFCKEENTKGILPAFMGIATGVFMGALALKSFILAVALPIVIFGMIMVLRYPITGIFAAVFCAPLLPTMIIAGLCVFSLFSLFCKKSRNFEHEWKTTGVGAFLILLLILFFVSNLFSFSILKSMLAWGMYFIFFSFYFVILNTVKSKEQLYSLLKVFVISGAVVSVYGILQYIFKWNFQPNAWIDKEMFEDATMRAYSTLENPNVLGEYLLLILPIAAVFMIKLDFKRLSKWVYIAVFAACALCLVFTQSRGCWLGFLLSTAIFVTFYKGKLWALVPIVLVILPFFLPQTIIDRVMSIGNMGDSSTSYRVYIWYGTVEMLRTYFVGGIGMGEGAFRTVYPFYGYDAIIAPHSHNLYLQLLTEAGIGALILFLVMMICFIKNNAAICKKSVKNSYDYLISLALSAGVLGFLLQSMFDYTFYNYRVMGIFMMYLAFGAVLKGFGERSINEENN